MACPSAALAKLRSPAVLVAQNGTSLALPNYMADEVEQSRASIVAVMSSSPSIGGSRSCRSYASAPHASVKSGDDSGEDDDDSIPVEPETLPGVRARPSPSFTASPRIAPFSPRASAQQQSPSGIDGYSAPEHTRRISACATPPFSGSSRTTSQRFPSGAGPHTRHTSPSPHRQTTSSSESAATTAHQADRIATTAAVSRRPLSARASTLAQAPGGAAAAATAAEQDLVAAVTGRIIQQCDYDDDFLDEEELAQDLMAAQRTLARALELARGGSLPAKGTGAGTGGGVGGGGDCPSSSSSSSSSQHSSQQPNLVVRQRTTSSAQVVEVEITPASSFSSSSLSQQPRSGFTSVRSALTETGAGVGAGTGTGGTGGVGAGVGSLVVLAFSASGASNAGGGGAN